jgi:hypothetical protein
MTSLPPGGVLALDLSTKVGWCYGPVTGKLPLATGTWELPTFNGAKLGLGERVPFGSKGSRGMALQNDLIRTFLCVGRSRLVLPDEIVLEKALPPQAQTQTETCYLQYGLGFLVHTEACTANVPVSEIDAWTVRREVFGVALRSMNPKYLKLEILKLIRRRGIAAGDHHQADAAAVWLWHKQRVTHGAGPLWEEYAA